MLFAFLVCVLYWPGSVLLWMAFRRLLGGAR